MNKFQKKLNATTKYYIRSYTEELLKSNESFSAKGWSNSNTQLEKVLDELFILSSKSYYRWVRVMVKSQVEKEFQHGNTYI